MILSFEKFKISHFDVIRIILIINSIVMLIKDLISSLEVLSYIVDVLNVILFFMAINKVMKTQVTRKICLPFFMALILLDYDVLEFIFYQKNLLLFLWGIRQNYRFIVFFLSAIILCEKDDVENFFDLLTNILTVNFLVVTIEAALGLRQDRLSGTFGINVGSNGSANLLIVICLISFIVDYLYLKISDKKMLFFVSGIIIWASLAELKCFFVIAVIIIVLTFLLFKKNNKKIYNVVIVSLIGIIGGTTFLEVVSPYYKGFFTAKNIVSYSQNIGMGIGGYGRLNAISKANEIFFNKNVFLELFGIGIGNAEYSSISFLNSEFHERFYMYNYDTIFYSMVYIERGLLGLVWYISIFLLGISICVKKRKTGDIDYKPLYDKALILYVAALFLMIYDDSLRRAFGGYVIWFLLSIPYICIKQEEGLKTID